MPSERGAPPPTTRCSATSFAATAAVLSTATAPRRGLSREAEAAAGVGADELEPGLFEQPAQFVFATLVLDEVAVEDLDTLVAGGADLAHRVLGRAGRQIEGVLDDHEADWVTH